MRSSFKLALIGAAFLGLLAGSTGATRAQEVTLKLHHLLPPVAHGHKNMLAPWAKTVEDASGGRIKIDIYPAMQLYSSCPSCTRAPSPQTWRSTISCSVTATNSPTTKSSPCTSTPDSYFTR
jgi:hypothetical protein